MIVGFIRFVWEITEPPKESKKRKLEPLPINISEVAAVVPAHNEENSIRKTIQALIEVLPRQNIYVVSDSSTDNTIKIVRSLGVRSLDLSQNRGKAKALVYIMSEYRLFKSYKAILINDADTVVDSNFIISVLQYFRDENVVAVSPHGRTRWARKKLSELFLIAYRARLWKVVQLGLRYGQTWKAMNVSYIIPGAFSIYRTSVLEQLEIDAPGLIIEDFSMTFEIQKKKLGKIIYSPKIFATHEDPYSLDDYIKQQRRWNVGFWQTVKRHGIWPSFFWLSTGLYLLELTFYTLFVLLLPLIVSLFILNGFQPVFMPVFGEITILDFVIGVFLIDYVVTIVVAILERKPIMLLLGLGFIFLRFIDAIIFVISVPEAFFKQSSGRWISPKRL